MTSCRALLESHLAELDHGLSPVLHDNEEGAPPPDALWLRMSLRPLAMRSEGSGAQGDGLLCLAVSGPAGTGAGQVEQVVETLAQHFRDRRLTGPGLVVSTGAPLPGLGVADRGAWRVDLDVPFRSWAAL